MTTPHSPRSLSSFPKLMAAGTLLLVALAGCSSGSPVGPGQIYTSLLFSSDRSGSDEIYALEVENSLLTQITSNMEPDRDPAYNANRTRIAWASDVEMGPAENFEIWIMKPDGADQVRLTNDPGEDRRPIFNPAGNRIVFMTSRNGNWDIYSMSNTGTLLTQLTTDGANDIDPVFSPDGSKIYFASDRAGQFDIWRMNVDGSDQEVIVSDFGSKTGPVFGPDGQLYFSANFLSQTSIYKTVPGSMNVTRLTNSLGADTDPRPVNNNQIIAFTTNRTGNLEVYTMRLDGTVQSNVTNNPAADRTE